ncbi:MAG: hypothetical protein K2Y23_14890 [Cyanobacteria bacterium]|nr:hypothetical protein [Cyanobacteriota bacterium]
MTYTFSRSTVLTFALLALALVASNVYAVYQNQHLRTVNESVTRTTFEVAPGTAVPTLHGATADGKQLELAYNVDRATLLLVFGPKCVFSNNNWSQWESILSRVDKNRVQVGFVNASIPDKIDETFLIERGIADQIVMNTVDPADRATYKLSLTPQTLIVDRAGVVRYVKTGQLDQEAIEAIMQHLSASAIVQVSSLSKRRAQ